MIRKLLFGITLLFSFSAMAQIQHEYSTNYSGNWAELEVDGSVFYTMDVPGEKCRIYKPGFQQWKVVNINVPNNRWLTDIQYLSQHLFDNDDGVEMLIVYYEYVQTSTSYYYVYTTQVIDENGDVLLDVPQGSYSLVYNTRDAGTKLMVYQVDYSVYPYPVTTHVYSLPGVLMGAENQELTAADDSFIKAWPNPSSGNFTLDYRIPGQPRESWFIIYDLNGSEVHREALQPQGNNHESLNTNLPSGQYIYRIVTPNYQSKGNKIIINR